MIRTNAEITGIITGDSRIFGADATFNYLALKHDPSVQIYANNAVDGSIPDQIIEPMVPYSHDRLFTGSDIRNRVFPWSINIHRGRGWQQKRTFYKNRIGYIGNKADEDGNVDDTIQVRFAPRNISLITIQTDCDRIIHDAVITSFNGDIKTNEYELKDNQSDTLLIPWKGRKASIISITITKGTPGKRIWLITFSPTKVEHYTEDDIIEIKHEIKKAQNKEGSIGRLYIQSLSMSLFNNKERPFDFMNTKSDLYNSLRKGVEISVDLPLKGTSFKKELGVFYTTSWEVSEDTATAAVKAVDYLGTIKDNEINELIIDNTNVMDCFLTLANRLGLFENKIDQSLEKIALAKYALQGKAGDLLNNLCELSQSVCFMNARGNGITVRKIPSIRGTSRYPLRYLTSGDYSKSTKNKMGDVNPNIIRTEYTIEEYQTNEVIVEKEVFMYKDFSGTPFPEEYKNKGIFERPVGAGTEPSVLKIFKIPEHYIHTEITDPFTPGTLEYEITEYDGEYPEEEKRNTVEVRVWIFNKPEEEDAQFTIAVIGKSSYEDMLLENFTQKIEKRPNDYVDPDLSKEDPFERNKANKPQEFEVKLSGKYSISYIIPGNLKKELFDFVITKTGTGCLVKVWNYSVLEQEFAVSIYGKRIIESKDNRVILLKDDDAIALEGEITKSINLKGIASDEIANQLARSTARYYKTFKNSFSVDPWADPRFEINDLIALESPRGYGYTQGIIEEVNTTYKGFLEQKIKLLESNKHNRDCRLFGELVLNDRPVMPAIQEGYV
ncbi:hypothetical protein [Breznakiella homolactica]|uniref:Uncharacterized protein n=1 Tax=Breznakiella homolactica TaxID=2798577 RepID=A0A7T8BCC2_9SPIR|nr:hypothetical protein [Breznakiella homolactica]QQO10098.1 hypothetical protein JFL75_04045 [Breznakiella homolactica]